MRKPLVFSRIMMNERRLRQIVNDSPDPRLINYLAKVTPLRFVGFLLGSKHITPQAKLAIQNRLKKEAPRIPLKKKGYRQEKSDGPLRMLDIELTERCNFSCCHCYICQRLNDKEIQVQEMTLDLINSLLLQGLKLGLKAVRFTGGEPMARSDFAAIYNLAAKHNLDISLSTNATLITGSIAKAMAENPPCSVSVSIYGWDDASCEAITGRKWGFKAFLRGIEWLKRYKIPFDLKYPPIRNLIDNREKIERLARLLGSTGSLPNAWEMTMRARREEEFNQRICAMRLSPVEAAKLRLMECDMAVNEYCAFASTSGKRFTGRLLNCRAGRDRLTVDAYGNLQLCLELRHPSTIYDLKTGNLKAAIEEYVPAVLDLRFSNEETINRCGKCILYKRCITCPACSWTENGTLESISEYHCQVMHFEAQLLGVLEKDQKGWETTIDQVTTSRL